MKRVLGVLVGLMLLAPAVAQATTIQTSDGSRPWQDWTDTAQVPTWAGTLPFTVTSDYFDCGGLQAAGCSSLTPLVDQTTEQIMPQGTPLASVSTEVDGGQGAWQDKATLYHELGQVFWAEYLTTADEAAFMQIVGLGSDASQWGNWLVGTRVIDGQTYHFPPFEWFAEGYRYCAEYGINQPYGVHDEEGLWYPGDQAAFAPQQRQVCRFIDAIGVRDGIATPPQTTYAPTHLSGHVVKVRIGTGRSRHRTARLDRLDAR